MTISPTNISAAKHFYGLVKKTFLESKREDAHGISRAEPENFWTHPKIRQQKSGGKRKDPWTMGRHVLLLKIKQKNRERVRQTYFSRKDQTGKDGCLLIFFFSSRRGFLVDLKKKHPNGTWNRKFFCRHFGEYNLNVLVKTLSSICHLCITSTEDITQPYKIPAFSFIFWWLKKEYVGKGTTRHDVMACIIILSADVVKKKF